MPDYTRRPQRFFYKGVSLLPQDALPEGKAAFAQNIRSYQEGTVTPRYGLTLQSSAPLGAPIHSLFRLNDTTLFGGGNPERRIVGAGTGLFGGTPGLSAYGLIDPTPYSGNPLTGVVAAPVDSPRPFLYVGDSVRARKINSDLSDTSIGQPPPLNPPTARFAPIETTVGNSINTSAWVVYGASVGPNNIVTRGFAGTIFVTQLIYDNGVTGMASVALDHMEDFIVQGTTVDIDLLPATPERVIVQEVHP